LREEARGHADDSLRPRSLQSSAEIDYISLRTYELREGKRANGEEERKSPQRKQQHAAQAGGRPGDVEYEHMQAASFWILFPSLRSSLSPPSSRT